MSDRESDCIEECSTYPVGATANAAGTGYPMPNDMPTPTRRDRESYPVSNSEMFNINIEPLNFGFLVTVGCQRFAIETKETLVKDIAAYLADPRGVYEAWFAGSFKP